MKYDVSKLKLRTGETKRVDCPYCNGKNTFTITNTGTDYIWNCYRSSCQQRGRKSVAVRLDGLAYMMSDVKLIKPTEDRPVDTSKFMDTGNSRVCLDMLLKYNSFSAWNKGLINTWYDAARGRLVFGICDPKHIMYSGDMKYVVDYMGRLLSYYGTNRDQNRARPKWKRYGSTLHSFICPDINRTYDSIVVVEDCFSACAVCELAAGVALLGTTLHEQHVNDIMALKPNEVIICLDPDAQKKSLDISNKLAYYVPKVRIVNPPNDLKYFTTNELRDILGVK